MKKAEVGVTELVYLLAFAVALIILVLVFSGFGDVLQKAATKKDCQWNLLLSSITKAPIIGTETIPPECQMTRVNITKKQLEDRKSANKREIEEFNKDYENNQYISFRPTISKELMEYELDKVVANEIKDCWEMAWMGQMPLFKEWWSLLKCEIDSEGKFKCGCAAPKEDCSALGEVWDRIKVWNYDVQRPPAFCVLCSRIKFDDEIKKEFTDEIKSLPEWMQKHPVLVDAQKRSYYEYTKDDANKGLFAPSYKYKVDKPLAVVYARVNVLKPQHWAENVLEWTGIKGEASEPVNILSIMPYDEVTNVCTYIIG